MTPEDPLRFTDTKGYADRLVSMRRSTGQRDAFRWGRALIDGQPVCAGLFVFEFMGGSMGSVVGEKITRLFERAREERLPALVLCASASGSGTAFERRGRGMAPCYGPDGAVHRVARPLVAGRWSRAGRGPSSDLSAQAKLQLSGLPSRHSSRAIASCAPALRPTPNLPSQMSVVCTPSRPTT